MNRQAVARGQPRRHNENHSQLRGGGRSLKQQVCLVSGPPGCGKTAWALQTLQSHQGTCTYLRLAGDSPEGLEQGRDSGIDQAWLQDQIPTLQPAQNNEQSQDNNADGQLTVIELQQFRRPERNGIDGYGAGVLAQLERLQLQPTQTLHFGRDPELPSQDTLDFS